MGLLDYLKNAKENYDRLREEQKKRSLLSQLSRAASAIIPDPVEQKIGNALSPIFSGAKESARQAAVNTASFLPIFGPAANIVRGVSEFNKLPEPAQREIGQNVGATARLAGAVGKGIVSGVGEFSATQMDRVFGFNGQKPLDIGGIARDVGAIPRDFLIRPTYRAATGFATSGISKLMGMETPESIPAPTSKLGQFFLGTDPINSIRGTAQSAPQTAEALGYSPGFARNVAPFLGVGLMASDIVPLNPKKAVGKVAADVAGEAAEKLAREAAEKLAREVATVDVDAYLAKLANAQVAARKSGTPNIIERISNAKDKIGTTFVDKTLPVTRRLDTYEGMNLLGNRKREILDEFHIDRGGFIDNALASDQLGEQFLKDKGFEPLIQEVTNLGPNALRDFQQFSIARHAPDLIREKFGDVTPENYGKFFGNERSMAGDAALLARESAKFEPYAARLTQFSNDLLEYGVGAELFTKETADMLRAKYPNYVPLQRIFSEIEEAVGDQGVVKGAGGPASLSKQTVLREIDGSSREVREPLESYIERTMDAFRQGERNKAAKTLANYVHLEGNPFNLRQLTSAGDKASNKGTFNVLRNGVKEIWETDPDIAAVAKGLGSEQLDSVMRAVGFVTRVFKGGTTGINLPFALPNMVADFGTAVINSPSALSTVLSPKAMVQALAAAVNHGSPRYQEAVRRAATMVTADISRSLASKSVKSIQSGASLPRRAAYLATTPKEWLRAIENTIGRSEEIGRLAQDIGLQDYYKKQGMPEARAKLRAAAGARFTTANFRRGGTAGKSMGAIWPYMRAAIAGSRSMYRAFRERPISTAAKFVVAVGAPTAALTVWNLSDPKRREAYQDIQEWEHEGNFTLVPSDPEQDEQGRWITPKLKMPPGHAELATPIRKFVEALYGIDQVSFRDFAQALLGAAFPITVDLDPDKSFGEKGLRLLSDIAPQIIKPSVEVGTNKNLYTGKKIVPASLEDKPAELQTYDWTSGSARDVGRILGISPIKAEHFVKAQFGQVGSQLLNILDSVRAATGGIPEEQVGGEGIVENIVRRFSKSYGGDNKDAAYEEVQQYVDRQDRASADLKARAIKIDADLLTLSPAEATARYNSIKASDPKLAEKLKDVAEERKLGLTSVEKAIKGLTVEERAQYVYDKLQKLETDAQRAALWEDYVTKKIISDNVSKRLQELLGK